MGCVIGKYDPLHYYLLSQTNRDEVTATFAGIESVVGPLPSSARTSREWWANSSTAAAKAWRTAGWSVRAVDLAAERVVFVRESSKHRVPAILAGRNKPPQAKRRSSSRRGWSKRHPTVVAVWITVAASLIVASVLGAIHFLASSANPADSATTIADRVSSCIRNHGMTGASDGPRKPVPGVSVPFSRANDGRYFSNFYDSGPIPIPVSLYESCSWPPAPGADVTGYSRILVSTVAGSAHSGGQFDPTSDADVLDTSCAKMTIKYIGGHTGLSFSETVGVSAGSLTIVDKKMMYPGEPKPTTVGSWGFSVGDYVTPGETVVLHNPNLSILNIACSL